MNTYVLAPRLGSRRFDAPLRPLTMATLPLRSKREIAPAPPVEIPEGEDCDAYRAELLNSGLAAAGLDGLQKCFPQRFDQFQVRSSEHSRRSPPETPTPAALRTIS